MILMSNSCIKVNDFDFYFLSWSFFVITHIISHTYTLSICKKKIFIDYLCTVSRIYNLPETCVILVSYIHYCVLSRSPPPLYYITIWLITTWPVTCVCRSSLVPSLAPCNCYQVISKVKYISYITFHLNYSPYKYVLSIIINIEILSYFPVSY